MTQYNRRCKAGDDASQKSTAECAFNEMKLTVMPSPSTFSRLCKNRTHFEDKEPSFVPGKKGENRTNVYGDRKRSPGMSDRIALDLPVV